jgi:hypothetical protein
MAPQLKIECPYTPLGHRNFLAHSQYIPLLKNVREGRRCQGEDLPYLPSIGRWLRALGIGPVVLPVLADSLRAARFTDLSDHVAPVEDAPLVELSQ